MHIVVEAVSKRFGSNLVFDNFSAEFESGHVTALTGPSGSGKSTLLAILTGLQKADSGTVRFKPLEGGSTSANPDMVMWVPQGMNALPDRSVLDNAMIGAFAWGVGLSEGTATAQVMLSKVGLEDRINDRAKTLSGGELQRLAFARALCSQAPIIIADEPTANLDSANTAQVAELLHHMTDTRLVIVASHDPVLIGAATATVSMRP